MQGQNMDELFADPLSASGVPHFADLSFDLHGGFAASVPEVHDLTSIFALERVVSGGSNTSKASDSSFAANSLSRSFSSGMSF
mmetsp:Transcript_55898/g.147781  ORF Transcript_55898/g.147781 Transcript_55898/m.147781 type:complete len:83 (-) Transcript_55898:444-692(-)